MSPAFTVRVFSSLSLSISNIHPHCLNTSLPPSLNTTLIHLSTNWPSSTLVTRPSHLSVMPHPLSRPTFHSPFAAAPTTPVLSHTFPSLSRSHLDTPTCFSYVTHFHCPQSSLLWCIPGPRLWSMWQRWDDNAVSRPFLTPRLTCLPFITLSRVPIKCLPFTAPSPPLSSWLTQDCS